MRSDPPMWTRESYDLLWENRVRVLYKELRATHRKDTEMRKLGKRSHSLVGDGAGSA